MMSANENVDLHRVIDEGIRRAVRKALQRHKLAGQSVYVWRDGKVVEIPPQAILVTDSAETPGRTP